MQEIHDLLDRADTLLEYIELLGRKLTSSEIDKVHALLVDVEWVKARIHKVPTVVCLCGSTRFSEAFQKANLDETLAGNIVLTIGCDTKSDGELFGTEEEKEQIKAKLDELHLRKIDLADEVLFLNVGGYMGESTHREHQYAVNHGKVLRYLEEPS